MKCLSLKSTKPGRGCVQPTARHLQRIDGRLKTAPSCGGLLPSRSASQSGSAIFVTLVVAGVVGLTLAAYLSWANTQNKLAFRSQCWNAALPMAEAGLEEALTHLHDVGLTNLPSNGWASRSNGWYFKKNYVDGRGYYEVNIKMIAPPVIVATGFVPAPLSTTTHIQRRIRVTTSGGTPIDAAIISKGPITLSGNNVTVDSFDSSDDTGSTGGKFDPTKSRDNGNVITMGHDGLTANKKPIYALDVGDADIKGHVVTVPDATINVTSSGSVGDSAWVNSGTPGIQPGYSSADANVGVDDVEEPFSGGYYTPTLIPGNSVPYNYVLALGGNYKIGSLSGKVLVAASNVVLWVTDDLRIGSGEFIEIAPGASLKLYVSAATATIAGQGVINDTGFAQNFLYFGLPSNTAINYTGNSAFYGMINAPQATLKLGGGGTTDFDFSGALIVGSLTMNGHYHVHYDEALQKIQSHPLVVSTWNEVDANSPVQ
jgi:Putative Ice-binding-like adhesive domain